MESVSEEVVGEEARDDGALHQDLEHEQPLHCLPPHHTLCHHPPHHVPNPTASIRRTCFCDGDQVGWLQRKFVCRRGGGFGLGREAGTWTALEAILRCPSTAALTIATPTSAPPIGSGAPFDEKEAVAAEEEMSERARRRRRSPTVATRA